MKSFLQSSFSAPKSTNAVIDSKKLIVLPASLFEEAPEKFLRTLTQALQGGPAVYIISPHEENRLRENKIAFNSLCWHLTGPAANTAVVLRTSGSSSLKGQAVALSAENLVASAAATQDFLADVGSWAVMLPVWHVAGLQMLIRSIVYGYRPYLLSLTSFNPDDFAKQIGQLLQKHPETKFISLVPTQLHRCLDNLQAIECLRRFHRVIGGGAHVSPALQNSLKAAGVALTQTYGSTETSGGCVYDGLPLAGTEISFTSDATAATFQNHKSLEGRILLTGPSICLGKFDKDPLDLPPLSSPKIEENPVVNHLNLSIPLLGDKTVPVRRFRTSDLGEMQAGRLKILGRCDDAITCGGETINLSVMQRVLEDHNFSHPISDLAITSMPDEKWGDIAVVVMKVPDGSNFFCRHDSSEPSPLANPLAVSTPDWSTGNILGFKLLSEAREQIMRSGLEKTYRPKALVTLTDFPLLANGKLDRLTLRQQVKILASGKEIND